MKFIVGLVFGVDIGIGMTLAVTSPPGVPMFLVGLALGFGIGALIMLVVTMPPEDKDTHEKDM